jgi:DnaJ-class molecular chaperone
MIELSYLPDIKVKNEQKESYVMSGVGLPYMTDDGEIKRGDIYLKIHISVPQNVPKEFIDYIKTI